MCGISGILWPDAEQERRQRVARMTETLVHRGPDDSGEYHDDMISLGFRRLSVIDLETGQQPIVLDNDRAVIVLNGEIYNFRELRRELTGESFKSKGDVEVVLRLYARHGIGCLSRLNGMFALAIWDRQQQTLYLARDRFGIKPLYYARHHHGLAFASELRALLAGGFPAQTDLNLAELGHYLTLGYLSPVGTPLQGAQALAPASLLTIGPDGGETITRYWTPPEPQQLSRSRTQVRDELAGCLAAAVKRQLVADVPVGVFLSGGLDSSTITALACRADTARTRTFSIGFQSSEVVNELPGARQVASLLGTAHHELTVDPTQVAIDLEAIIAGLDCPLADATAIPTWYMSQLARTRVTVALSGEGADEIFGGYARQRYDAGLDRIGAAGRTLLPALLRLTGRQVSDRLAQRLRMPAGLQRQLDWARVFTSAELDALSTRQLPPESTMIAPYQELARSWQTAEDPVNIRLTTDRETFLPGDLLPKVDRMSMAHSLEVRVPFLDNEVTDLMLPLPGRFKQSLCRDKIILRQAAATILPPVVARRRKQGFDVPISTWLRGPLREALVGFLAPETVARRGLLCPQQVGQMVDQHLRGDHDHGRSLWALLVLEAWLQLVGSPSQGQPA
jgi:asparagine synthase (glutamine-hydrolysing)